MPIQVLEMNPSRVISAGAISKPTQYNLSSLADQICSRVCFHNLSLSHSVATTCLQCYRSLTTSRLGNESIRSLADSGERCAHAQFLCLVALVGRVNVVASRVESRILKANNPLGEAPCPYKLREIVEMREGYYIPLSQHGLQSGSDTSASLASSSWSMV